MLSTPVIDHLAVGPNPSQSTSIIIQVPLRPPDVINPLGGDQVGCACDAGLEMEPEQFCVQIGEYTACNRTHSRLTMLSREGEKLTSCHPDVVVFSVVSDILDDHLRVLNPNGLQGFGFHGGSLELLANTDWADEMEEIVGVFDCHFVWWAVSWRDVLDFEFEDLNQTLKVS